VGINQVVKALHDLIDEDAIWLNPGRTATLLLRSVLAGPEGIGAGEMRLEVIDSVRRGVRREP
jgi:hypothetical protein